jgi:hypothetical protein
MIFKITLLREDRRFEKKKPKQMKTYFDTNLTPYTTYLHNNDQELAEGI